MKRLLSFPMRRDEFLKWGAVTIGLALTGAASLIGKARAAGNPAAGAGSAGSGPARVNVYSAQRKGYVMVDKVIKTDAEWRKQLTREQFGSPGKGDGTGVYRAYWNAKEAGIYRCLCCGTTCSVGNQVRPGTGWPSLRPVAAENIRTEEDNGFFMRRMGCCGAVRRPPGTRFLRRSKPTGLRYCMNSAALRFVKTE